MRKSCVPVVERRGGCIGGHRRRLSQVTRAVTAPEGRHWPRRAVLGPESGIEVPPTAGSMAVMQLKVVRYGVSDRVATVTLDRPDRLNSWTGRMHAEYRWALAEAERDRSVRVIVVTGEGTAFCAGADSRALSGHVERGAYDAGTPGISPVPDSGSTPGSTPISPTTSDSPSR